MLIFLKIPRNYIPNQWRTLAPPKVQRRIACAVTADLVFAAELFAEDSDELASVHFFCWATGQGRRGRFPRCAELCRLTIVRGDGRPPYNAGLLLRHEREDFIESHGRGADAPLNLATEGPMTILSDDEITASLCYLDERGTCTGRVVLNILDWTEELVI